MDGKIYRCKLSAQNKALWDLVKPDDYEWHFDITGMSDFDKIFQKITSVPNWKQDKVLVYLFTTMRTRKHMYFNETFFEEDLVIVPCNDYSFSTAGLSEEEIKLSQLVTDLVYSSYNRRNKECYDQVYEQFDAITKWQSNPYLVRLHKQVKDMEATDIKPKDPQIEQEKNEKDKKETDKWVNKHKEKYEEKISEKRVRTEDYFKTLLWQIRKRKNWRHHKTLFKWHGLLATIYRIHLMKQNGTSWQSRIVHDQSQSSKGLLQRMWERIWPSKKNDKPPSQN